MMRCCSLGDRIQPFLVDYDRIQYFAVILIYIQIACALVGSLGALYNGVLLIDLAISLFALVAIESSSQSLSRAYAVLLFCAILLDIAWLSLFTNEIWNISSESYGTRIILSLKLAFSMQIAGFSVRLLSSLLWIQMYRLGVSNGVYAGSRESNFYLRNSFLTPAAPAIGQPSDSDDFVGGSIYNPPHFSSLFESGEGNGSLCRDENAINHHTDV